MWNIMYQLGQLSTIKSKLEFRGHWEKKEEDKASKGMTIFLKLFIKLSLKLWASQGSMSDLNQKKLQVTDRSFLNKEKNLCIQSLNWQRYYHDQREMVLYEFIITTLVSISGFILCPYITFHLLHLPICFKFIFLSYILYFFIG